MKAQITWPQLRTYALTSALVVFLYTVLGHLIGLSHSPTTIRQFLVLFVLILSLTVVVHLYRSRRKKSPVPPDGDSNNGKVK